VIDPRLIAPADAPQLELPPREIDRLKQRIRADYDAAQADHQQRMRRFQAAYRRFRGRTDPQLQGQGGESNFLVPVTQWAVYAKLAKETAAIFGEGADVMAEPVGPSDRDESELVSAFLKWRVFNDMSVVLPATTFNFRKVVFGRAHALSTWERRTYRVPLRDGGEAEEVAYEGPGFEPLWPDDLVVPAEDARTIHDFTWCIVKSRATPNDLLLGEDAGKYQGVEARFEDIVNFAADRKQRDSHDTVKSEKDLAEGVLYEGNLSGGSVLPVWKWYGKWRMLKGRADARLDNFRGRNRYESDLVVSYLPDLDLVIGIQDLAQMYPRKAQRRPIVEAAMSADGSYWCAGYGELLDEIEKELSSNHNLAQEAGEMTVGPPILYRPGTGFDPENQEYGPRSAIACDDPLAAKQMEIQANFEWPMLAEQKLIGYVERITGISDMNLGRSIDRPNAPKTARQTIALLEEGDVRGSLELTILREHWNAILKHFWELEQDYAPESVFFRVTEKDSKGLLDRRRNGGYYMTARERAGRYDFKLKFASSTYSKQQKREERLGLYQIDLQNPLIVQNPRALWVILNEVHKAFGDERFAEIIPEPPDLGLPKSPVDEWNLALEGRDVHVNPLDPDELHLIDHKRRLEEAAQDPERDQYAYDTMVAHVYEHMQQIRQKQLMVALAGSLAQSIQQNTQLGRGLMSSQMPMPLQHVGATIAQLNPMGMGGQPGDGTDGARPGDAAAA
jgi:hypothetical protein